VLPILLFACLFLPAPSATAQPAGVATVPPARRESIPPVPYGDRFVWQPGAWQWDEAEFNYIWRPGRYVVRRPGTTAFVQGRWVQTGGEWVWRRARWR